MTDDLNWIYTIPVPNDIQYWKLSHFQIDGSSIPNLANRYRGLFALATLIGNEITLFDIKRIYGNAQPDLIYKPIPKGLSDKWFLAFKKSLTRYSSKDWLVHISYPVDNVSSPDGIGSIPYIFNF